MSSGPQGTWGHLSLFLLLKLLVGSIQICEHLQQVGSCLPLPDQGIRTGPWERDKGSARPGQPAIIQTQLPQAPDLPVP